MIYLDEQPDNVSTRVEKEAEESIDVETSDISSRIKSFGDYEVRLQLAKELNIPFKTVRDAYKRSGVVGVARLVRQVSTKKPIKTE